MTESTDKQLPDEQQLDEYLKGDSSVSRQYRQLHSAEVPAELDRLVLRNAEDAVKGRSVTRPAWLRWSAPLAVAASAVLALSIVIETGLRDETVVTSQKQAEPPIETRMIEEPAQGVAPESPLANQDLSNGLRMETEEMPEEVSEPPAPKREAPASPAPPMAPQAAPRSSSAPVSTAAPAPEVKAEALSRRSVADDAAGTAVQEEVAQAAQRDVETFAAEVAREEQQSAAQRALSDAQPMPQMSYSRPISANMATLPRTYSDPEAWLKDIRQLRKDNKQEQADHEWRRFRAAFPNYEVAEADLAREVKK